MKRWVIGISAVMAIFAIATFVWAEDSVAPEQPAKNGAPPPANPLKVAILHWYQANQTTSVQVGKQPYGVAFDGENIWSANNGDGTVSKVRASDGKILGTFTVGGQPMGLVYDGANMWVTDNFGTTITKLWASDGKNLGSFEVGPNIWFPAFDGQNIWIGAGDVATTMWSSCGPVTGRTWGNSVCPPPLRSPLMGRTFGSPLVVAARM